MGIRARRRLDLLLLALAGLVAAAAALIGAAGGDSERVIGLWAGAEVGAGGGARVAEVIDYDFGIQRRHGIFRDVPGLSPEARVSVSSPTAPDQVELIGMGSQTRIRVGDPSRTVGGRHRYTIRYPLAGVAPGGRLAWDAVGTGWQVRLGDVRVHVVAPFELRQARCVRGTAGASTPCALAQPQPGHLVATVDALRPGEGMTLYATAGRPLGDAPPLPAAPAGAPAEPTSGLLLPALVAGAAALAAAAPASRLVRLAGRERVAVGGAAEAAWAGSGEQVRVDAGRLASLATVEFAPPRELAPAEGGVLLDESVRDQHKVAWLIGAAIDGYVDLQGDGKDPTLVRLDRRDGPAATALELAFAGRQRLTLGKYDPGFAAAWRVVGEELEAWRRSSGLWDPAGDRRCTLARVLGGLAGLAGLAAAAAGGLLANRWHTAWLALVAAGALLAGAGLAALVRAWELRVRTPVGSGLWLRVESFRRFLAASEAHHAEEAAKRGVLRQYAAWAVAVGEISRWSRAVAASGAALDEAGARYSNVALWLPAVAASTATAPSSSGSGGGGGGVGGGAGGGGGGSW
jgi:Predicted membrane protein (DUF2207)